MGGISASGGPKNGISMASVDSVPTRNRYGMPKMVPTTATSAAWMPARITWVRRKPPKARPTLTLQDGGLVGELARHGAVELAADPLAVHQHVERQDQDQHQRAERRERRPRDLLRLVEDRPGHAADLRLRRSVQLDQRAWIQPQRLLVAGQRVLDPDRRLRELGGDLADLAGDRAAGDEHHEGQSNERQQVGDHHRQRAAQRQPLLEEAGDRRHDEGQQPGQEDDQDDLAEARHERERHLQQQHGEVGRSQDQEAQQPPSLAGTQAAHQAPGRHQPLAPRWTDAHRFAHLGQCRLQDRPHLGRAGGQHALDHVRIGGQLQCASRAWAGRTR